MARVSGEDRQTFLHGQLSNDINNLQTGQACYATYNTPKGRVIANMIVVNRGDDLLLIMAQDLLEATVKRLRMFVLRAKAVFEILEDYAVGAELAASAEPLAAQEPSLAFTSECVSDGICSVILHHRGILHIAPETALPLMTLPPKTRGGCTKSAAVIRGYARLPKKPPSPKCSTSTSSAAYTSKRLLPGTGIIARAQYRGRSNAAWRYCREIRQPKRASC
ncbi:putative aminomethyl transferase [Neisseria gonorrhoeae]|uniref:Putative aminomethyl transferase n=1 Tax=Neisseria gonorrhoeae TaxID=485 RepID=A0A378VZR3_NEIGO|nr:putative aminomethyl transferase [Neisseria gonorrhoeae]